MSLWRRLLALLQRPQPEEHPELRSVEQRIDAARQRLDRENRIYRARLVDRA